MDKRIQEKYGNNTNFKNIILPINHITEIKGLKTLINLQALDLS